MATILDTLTNFQALNLKAEVPNIIQAADDAFIKLNQSQLYDKSIDSQEEPLLLYNSIGYALDKQRRNPPLGYGRPDLFDTGDFYNGFFLEVKSDSYLIYSKDNKTIGLSEKYGDDIFGLTQPNKEIFVNESVYPGIKSYIEAKTGLVLR